MRFCNGTYGGNAVSFAAAAATIDISLGFRVYCGKRGSLSEGLREGPMMDQCYAVLQLLPHATVNDSGDGRRAKRGSLGEGLWTNNGEWVCAANWETGGARSVLQWSCCVIGCSN